MFIWKHSINGIFDLAKLSYLPVYHGKYYVETVIAEMILDWTEFYVYEKNLLWYSTIFSYKKKKKINLYICW